ncbi:uncharacterized protein LOC135165421 [Diachasmimorpha longicaudata]|uniref:uncharacterized protein LOC135165421 n=1 Tax=Diachasmimorpha longicaudata TaxID=58733 RepID=UPI0030B8F769
MKIAVIVCAVLLVAGAQGSFVSESVTAIQQRIEAGIDAGLKQLEETLQNAQKKAKEVGEELKEKAEAIAQQTYEQIREKLRQIDERIVNITTIAAGVNVDECIQVGETLEPIVLAAITNMSSCIDDKIELGSGYIESIILVSNDAIQNLKSLRDEARNCSNGVEGIGGAVKAVLCANVAAAKATWATAKGVPSVTATVTKLSYLLSTLHITLPHCTAHRGFISLVRESDRVVAEVRSCVDRKIAEHQQSLSPSSSPQPEQSHQGLNEV